MTKTIFSILFMITILMTSTIIASVDLFEDADALKSKGTKTQKYGSKTDHLVCGDRLCSEIEEKEPKKEEKPAPKQETKQEETKELKEEQKSIPSPKTRTEQTITPVDHGWKYSSGTILSSQDPGVGHETHQLAIILPPTSKVYKGILTYSASEPIQLVALHGPLAKGDHTGQAIWTTDGKTKFALTFLDPDTSMGSWVFTGNAIAVHTLHSKQFSVSYSVSYMEKETSDTVMSKTIQSSQDPGIGHESHQLAIILPPSSKTYSGLLTYSASEPIQLVALHGPLEEGDVKGQAIWTTDNKTKYGLTLVDSNAAGTMPFAGNALAAHTFNEDPFTISYSIVAGQ